jgi:hypothetical protein
VRNTFLISLVFGTTSRSICHCISTQIQIHNQKTFPAVAQAVQCLTTGWMIGVRSPAGAEDFSSSPCVHTGSGAHPASCPMGTVPGVISPGGKRGWGVTLTTRPHLVPRLSMSRSYTSSPPMCHHGM